ncbi:hypothetical protein SASPL_111631 [Salvia splendens]|uniref:HMA domain-containing protein n=1 Tax=Salvia splendens TaxID=180675 RepID=A0A8X8YB43_SALSN|nr:protein SODIUM POTASSIUM ROOT DEFECTIVE 2-like [Salvia splendens]KAG6427387.1 hypothetical protein SASPL_111631 [Salvia splendens]
MKGMDISKAIMEQPSSSSSPAIDRYNPIITDSRRCAATPLPPIHPTSPTPTPTPSRKSWNCTKPSDFISPPGSTRYLLSGKDLLNTLSDLEPKLDESKHSSSSPSPDQVVVLRVSLHCRGCERKMRKHISRMAGVRSFNIDFAAKKVTVAGKITPLEVLSSISKVKNAQLWAPTITSEFKGAWLKDKGTSRLALHS